MYSRKFSLKSRYNFSKVLRSVDEFVSTHLIIKYRYDERLVNPKFGIITSNKLTKKTVEQNKIRRVIAKALKARIERLPVHYNFVIIPKKTFFNKNGKIDVSVEEINSEIDSFLSNVDFSRPKSDI